LAQWGGSQSGRTPVAVIAAPQQARIAGSPGRASGTRLLRNKKCSRRNSPRYLLQERPPLLRNSAQPSPRSHTYTRVRIHPKRILLRPSRMSSADLFNIANRSLGRRLAGMTGVG